MQSNNNLFFIEKDIHPAICQLYTRISQNTRRIIVGSIFIHQHQITLIIV